MSVMVAPSGQPFELRLGDQRAVVVEVGGALRSYVASGHELLDGYERRSAAPPPEGSR